MHLEPLVPPEIEPVSLIEAKNHLRVFVSTDDDLITGLIVAARQMCETHNGRAFITQKWILYSDNWDDIAVWSGTKATSISLIPTWFPRLQIPYPPLQSIDSINYIDVNGVLQTWDSTLYQISVGTPGRVGPLWNQLFPIVRYNTVDAINIPFTCGYGDTAEEVPTTIRQAMLLLIGHLYENRENSIVGQNVTELPTGVDSLLACTSWGVYR